MTEPRQPWTATRQPVDLAEARRAAAAGVLTFGAVPTVGVSALAFAGQAHLFAMPAALQHVTLFDGSSGWGSWGRDILDGWESRAVHLTGDWLVREHANPALWYIVRPPNEARSTHDRGGTDG